MSGAPSFASTHMSSVAHAAAEHDHLFPTASSARSSDVHMDPAHGGGLAERFDEDGILLDSAEPSRQVCSPQSLQMDLHVTCLLKHQAHCALA